MSAISVFDAARPEVALATSADPAVIGARLAAIGVRFERRSAKVALPTDADSPSVLAACAAAIAELRALHGYVTADVVRLRPDAANITALRAKFFEEHRHADDEVRWFVEGGGTFYLRVEQQVLRVTCARHDLISVPAQMRHWFDMGPVPSFTAVRLFADPAGWVAHPTGDPIAERFLRVVG